MINCKSNLAHSLLFMRSYRPIVWNIQINMYAKTHWIIFLSLVLLASVSPRTNPNVYAHVPSKPQTQTGISTIQTNDPIPKTTKDRKCDQECKIKTLIDLKLKKELAESLVQNCKELAKDPVHCIKVGASILKAESNLGKNCKNYNCFGIGSGSVPYDSYDEGVKDWVTRYNKYWYKAPNSSFFYPSAGEKAPSRYCVSEESSGSAIGCPNWQKNAQSMWNQLNKAF